MTREAILARAQSLASEAFVAASGPGGQNVNKVATAVQLRVNIYELGLSPPIFHRLKALAGNRLNAKGEIVLMAQSHRTQEANRAEARDRLAVLVTDALNPPKTRKKSRVNRIGKVKRLKAKKARGDIKATRGRVRF